MNKTKQENVSWTRVLNNPLTNKLLQPRTKKTKQGSFVDESWLYLGPKIGCLGIGKGKAVSGTNNYGWDPLWRQDNRHSLLYMFFVNTFFLDFYWDKILPEPWSLVQLSRQGFSGCHSSTQQQCPMAWAVSYIRTCAPFLTPIFQLATRGVSQCSLAIYIKRVS